MENQADKLMLSSTVGRCPDCGDERILIAVAETEFCCTTCDGAVFVLDGVGAAALVTRLAS
jgi:ribosomal protein S27E